VNVDASGVEAFITILGADWPDTVNKNVQHSNVNAPKTANALPYPLELKARAMADYFVVSLPSKCPLEITFLLIKPALLDFLIKASGEL